MATRVAIGGILILGMLAMVTLQSATILRVETADGDPVICQRMDPGAAVTLTFTHSMYGGNVDETWVLVGDGQLVRQQIVTDNAAAAEYYATDGRVQPEGSGFAVLAAPLAIDELIVRVDAVGNHRLTIGTTTWHLQEILTGPVQIRLSGDRMPGLRIPDTCAARASELYAKG